jgi:hypothetical protein
LKRLKSTDRTARPGGCLWFRLRPCSRDALAGGVAGRKAIV